MTTGGPAPHQPSPPYWRIWLLWIPLTSVATVTLALLLLLALLPVWGGVILFAFEVILFTGRMAQRSRSRQRAAMIEKERAS